MSYLRNLYYRLVLDIKAQVRYSASFFADIALIVILFIFFLLSNTGKSFADEFGGDYKSLLLAGYIVWTMAISAISTLAASINFETQNGTLQNMVNSKYPVEWILFTQFVSSQVINLGVIFVLLVISKFVFMIKITLSPAMILPIVFCVIGMFGIGLVIAGLSILIKKVSAFVLFLQLFLLFITDTIPTNEQLLTVTRYIPLTVTNNILRKIITNQSYINDFALLCITSVLSLVIGIVVFRVLMKKSIKNNILLLY